MCDSEVPEFPVAQEPKVRAAMMKTESGASQIRYSARTISANAVRRRTIRLS